jgi:predicted HD phosphohydrolase
MKQLTAEQIQNNWEELIAIINKYISEDRKENLLKMYDDFKERMMFAPASAKADFHNAMPGGYVEHILHIISFSLELKQIWANNGANINFTDEELIFAAMHHDLGKVGDLEHDYYIPQDSDWHRKNRGEIYKHNPALQYMKVPDRGLWLLQHYGVHVTDKEYIGIKLTDGLYDDANKAYLMSYNPDYNLRSNMAYILHQADMMATHIEYDEWKRGDGEKVVNNKVPKSTDEQKQIENMKSKFDELFT